MKVIYNRDMMSNEISWNTVQNKGYDISTFPVTNSLFKLFFEAKDGWGNNDDIVP